MAGAAAGSKLRIAFVIPWFGKNASGGAESECFGLVSALQQFNPEISVEVLTTALPEFAADWNHNTLPTGSNNEDGILVRRFSADAADRSSFGPMNEYRLCPKTVVDLLKPGGGTISPLTQSEEDEYLGYMVHSQEMTGFLEQNRNAYDFFVFIPYMFGTTVDGIKAVGPQKSIIIPCLHDERYAYMNLYRDMMASVKAALYHVDAEKKLGDKLYSVSNSYLLGEMVDVDTPKGDAARFREKFGIQGRFLLYAGRKIAGKGLPTLVDYFTRYRSEVDPQLALVIIGKGELSYSSQRFPGVYDLGFVSAEEKRDAFSAAEVFCMPSLFESFSIVLMEAWLQGTPVLIDKRCQVTKEHIDKSGGGLGFDDYASFRESCNHLLQKGFDLGVMGESGCAYVRESFAPRVVTKRFVDILTNL